MADQRKSPRIRSLFIDELDDYRRTHKEKDYVLIDVREPAEYEAGHIPGARLLPLSVLEAHLAELDPQRDLLFYCASGGRSQAAALLAADAHPDAKALINLVGGYYAWSGKELLDFPRVKIFQDVTDPRRALQQAMDLEKGAWLFYAHAQELLGDSPMAEAARSLQDLERRHAHVLYRILTRHDPEEPLAPFDELFDSLEGALLESGADPADELARLRTLPYNDCTAFGELALDIEYAAWDLYRNAAALPVSDPVREIFLELAEQEKAHVRVIAKTFAKCLS
ncbi:MAG: hypothetical protein H5U10_10775 [Desulfacinum sp.]|nr:hypothetical protein [Desulfacinum sp.]